MSGRLVVRASRAGADTLLAQITRVVIQAQATKACARQLADRVGLDCPGSLRIAARMADGSSVLLVLVAPFQATSGRAAACPSTAATSG